MGSEIVSVFVGKKRKEFNVHKKLICKASKFFNDAFTGTFKEGQDNKMYMPEDDPDVFACFVDWLYRNPLPAVEDNFEDPKRDVEIIKADAYKEFGPVTQEEHLQEVKRRKKEVEERKKAQDVRLGDQFGRLLKLYFFGEKIFIDELMNRTMDRIRQDLLQYDKFLTNREIKLVYENTSKGSMLRTFCAELLVYNLGSATDQKLDRLVTLMHDIPELAKDILVECKSLASFKTDMCEDWSDPGADPDPRSRGGDDFLGTTCCFHKHDSQHSSEEHCYDMDEVFRGPCPRCGYASHRCDCGHPH
jgi:hypothetical protein